MKAVSAGTGSGVLPVLAGSVNGVACSCGLPCAGFAGNACVAEVERFLVAWSLYVELVSFWTEVCNIASHGISFQCVALFGGKLVCHVAVLIFFFFNLFLKKCCSFEGKSVGRLGRFLVGSVLCADEVDFSPRVSIAGSRPVWFIYFSGGPLQMPKCPIHISQNFCWETASVDNCTIVHKYSA